MYEGISLGVGDTPVVVDEVLNALVEEAREEAPPALATKAHGIARVKYTHDAMIDLIITNPAISQNAIAAHFGYTASWVSQIVTSDAFQVRLAERREELVDPTIRATMEERFKGLVARSLDILAEKLNRPAHQIPDNLVLRTLEINSRAAGYGANRDPVAPTEVNVNVHLENLGENLVKLLQRKRADVNPPIDME